MKQKLTRLSRRYTSALRKHLKEGPKASLQPAQGLGQQAVSLGLDTLDVAKIHEGALANLEASSTAGRNHRAGGEFSLPRPSAPIEKTHQAALKAKTHLLQVHKRLDRRTMDLAARNRSLKQGIVQRKDVESALRKSSDHSKKLLEESQLLQQHLQHLAHQIMSAQENNRRKISQDLRDEIAQTLLGINVRLMALKKDAGANTESLQKEIAITRRIVDKSMKSIRRFAHEVDNHHEA
jgi:signal transduction histidine kinase